MEGCARGSVLLGTSRVVLTLWYDAAVIRTAYLWVQVRNVAAVPSCLVPTMDLLVTQHGSVLVYIQRTGKYVCYWCFATPSRL